MLRISRHRSRQIAIEMRCRKSIFSLLINFNYKHPPRALPTKSKRSLSAFAILQQCCRKISMYRYIYNHIMFMGICGACAVPCCESLYHDALCHGIGSACVYSQIASCMCMVACGSKNGKKCRASNVTVPLLPTKIGSLALSGNQFTFYPRNEKEDRQYPQLQHVSSINGLREDQW